MKKIPFYRNREDNKSCALAVYRSVLEYLTGKQYGWSEIEKLAGFEDNKAAWTVKIWTELAKRGFKIKMIESFDYESYYKQGEDYLRRHLNPEEVKWQLKNSNILQIKPLIPEFLRTVEHIQKSPDLSDIDILLEEGYLVAVQLNSRILNHKNGYVAHMVLVHDKEDGDYVAHDPGLTNAAANRIIEPKLLFEAMGGKNNNVEVTGIKI